MDVICTLRSIGRYAGPSLVFTAAIGSLSVAFAAPIVVEPATSYEGVMRTVGLVTDDLSRAQCGGWDLAQSVNHRIPFVTGAPGRYGKVFDSDTPKNEVLWSGMAWRDETSGAKKDGFMFPNAERALGLSTVCSLGEFGPSFPYKIDPAIPGSVPCTNERECSNVCISLNFWQYPVGLCPDGGGNLSIPWRGECRDKSINADTGIPDGCFFRGWKYCCSAAPVMDEATDALRNCLSCSGDGLEDQLNPGNDANGQKITDLFETGCRKGKETNGRPYLSFFRRYHVSYTRTAVKTGAFQTDVAERSNIPVRCYGPYEEFDPKVRRTTSTDQRCVIDLSEKPDTFLSMRQTQTGKGEYGVNEHGADPPFPRPNRDTRGDLWTTDISDAVSFVNTKNIPQAYGGNASPSLLPLDSADITSTVAGSIEKPLSDASLIRSTDDTVSNDRPGRRTFAEWWQEEETAMQRLFTPPVVRLILPTPRSIGLDPSDPFIAPPAATQAQASSLADIPPHLQTIDVELGAGEDIVSTVKVYLEHSLLNTIQEEPITVVVPLASPVELRALAQGWSGWARQQPLGEGRTKAEAIATKLEGYAQHIDDVRNLRVELAETLHRLFASQADISLHIAEWLTANMDALQKYQASWSRVLSIKPQWEAIAGTYRHFHDVTNMPWCRTDRFTTPIYSLLDPWLPGPSSPRDLSAGIDRPLSAPNGTELPRLAPHPLPDLVYDLSSFFVAPQSVHLPVLKPLQVRFDAAAFAPPTFSDTVQSLSARLEQLSTIDDLPAVPTLDQATLAAALPATVDVQNPPVVIDSPLPPLPDNIEAILASMQEIIGGMDRTYGTFWQSIMTPQPKYDCVVTGQMPCVHTEMDLLERFTRIGARPAILLKEDVLARGAPRTAPSSTPHLATVQPSRSLPDQAHHPLCPREDFACLVLNASETMPRQGWSIDGGTSDTETAIQTIRRTLREQTLQKNDTHSFPLVSSPEMILPSFDVPGPTPLQFEVSSSSS